MDTEQSVYGKDNICYYYNLCNKKYLDWTFRQLSLGIDNSPFLCWKRSNNTDALDHKIAVQIPKWG